MGYGRKEQTLFDEQIGGIMNASETAKNLSDNLFSITVSVYKELSNISEEESGKKPENNGWSSKEIIGHLIDSASNNHQRFVRAQFRSDLIFVGYDQDDWVKVQNYQSAPWQSLLQLWYEFNVHLSRLIENIPDETLLLKKTSHNLDEIAWTPIAKSEPVTLAYFIGDYIGHMQHHLKQIR